MKRFLSASAAVLLTVLLMLVFIPHRAAADLGESAGNGNSAVRIILPIALGVAVIVIAAALIRSRTAKNGAGNGAYRPGATRTAQSMLTPIQSYSALDPGFSPEAFTEWLKDLYCRMQDCCTKRDVEPIRPYFADSLWQQFHRQVGLLKAAHQTNHIDGISVLSVDIKGYYQDKGEDVIVAELYTRITDYTVDDETQKVISGSRTHEKYMTYEYSLSRPIGKKTEPRAEGASGRYCPNCGAPLSVNETVKCPYCGSVVSFGDHDWTVYSIKAISQRTA